MQPFNTSQRGDLEGDLDGLLDRLRDALLAGDLDCCRVGEVENDRL